MRFAEMFAENGIVVAFPQRDVHLSADRPLPVRVVGAGACRDAS
jgi:small-conductance mechanosensitive channel